MRVLLVQPDYNRTAEPGQELKERLLPARSLVELGALLERQGHQVTVLDPLIALELNRNDQSLDMVAALERLLGQEEFDVAGVAFYTPTRFEALELARVVKQHSKKIPVIAGGPHPSRLAASMLRAWPEIDYVCLGAADETLPAMVRALAEGPRSIFRMRNVAYRAGPRFIRERGKPSYHARMDGRPALRYDRYLERAPGNRLDRAYLMTARGCVHWCNFCSNLWKKMLLADPEAMATEVEHLVKEAGVERIIFYDDCFGARPDHARAVLEAVIRTGVKVELQAVTRFDAVESGWLELFKRAGGRDLVAGLETGSTKLRRKMNKHMSDSALCRGAELIRKMGIRLGVYVMFGFPGEDEADIEATHRLLKKLDPDQVLATVFDIKPGDLLFEFSLSAEILGPEAWLDEHRRLVNEMGPEELMRNAARAMAFERIFTRHRLLPEHDPAGFVLGLDRARLEPMIRDEQARWATNAEN